MVSCLNQSESPEPQPPAPDIKTRAIAGRTAPSTKAAVPMCSGGPLFASRSGELVRHPTRQQAHPSAATIITASVRRSHPPKKIATGTPRYSKVNRRSQREKTVASMVMNGQ